MPKKTRRVNTPTFDREPDNIYTKYGPPDTTYVNNQGYYVLFYGTYTPNTPHDLLKSGIEFITNYRYVKSIYICVR